LIVDNFFYGKIEKDGRIKENYISLTSLTTPQFVFGK